MERRFECNECGNEVRATGVAGTGPSSNFEMKEVTLRLVYVMPGGPTAEGVIRVSRAQQLEGTNVPFADLNAIKVTCVRCVCRRYSEIVNNMEIECCK